MGIMIFKFVKFRKEMFQENGIILRATPRNELNDPFEFLPPQSLYNQICKIYKIRKQDPPSFKDVSSQFFPFHGVISFTEAKENLLMWSHYADEHRGLVLGFDIKNSFFKELKRVRYFSKIPYEVISDINIDNNESLLPLFYIKSDEWIYEKEFRIVKDIGCSDFYKDEKNNLIKNSGYASLSWKHFFSVPYPALVSIFFGCKMNENDRSDILLMLKEKNISSSFEVFFARQSQNYFHLEFEKVK